MTITRASFAEIIERIHTIPSLPEVVNEVCKLVNDPNANTKQLDAIIVKDAAMAAKMLRMVNSVYYGLSQPVRSLDQAIGVLGFKTIRSIALSIGVINLFQQQHASFNMKLFWTHSAVCATLCRMLAQKAKLCDPELAFTVGLLKDIGKLILVENAANETRAIVAVAREYKMPFHAAAREVIDTDDAELGAWLMQTWGLEPLLVDAVRHQYDLDAAMKKGDDLGKIVSLCIFTEYLCGLKKIKVSGDCDEPQLNPTVFNQLGLDKTALVEVLTIINDEVDRARQLMAMAA